MSIFTMQLSIEVDSIRHFLEQNLKDIDAEISRIESNWDESQAVTEDDFGNLMYGPMKREGITLRATYYELNALIEHHLQSFAQEAYWKSAKYASTPKSLSDVPENEVARIKFVSDLKIDEIRRLIERYYEFSFDQIPQYAAICHIREIANSFKHRRGLKDFRRDPKAGLAERHELNRDDTRASVDQARRFLLEVYHKVIRTDAQNGSQFDDDNGA